MTAVNPLTPAPVNDPQRVTADVGKQPVAESWADGTPTADGDRPAWVRLLSAPVLATLGVLAASGLVLVWMVAGPLACVAVAVLVGVTGAVGVVSWRRRGVRRDAADRPDGRTDGGKPQRKPDGGRKRKGDRRPAGWRGWWANLRRRPSGSPSGPGGRKPSGASGPSGPGGRRKPNGAPSAPGGRPRRPFSRKRKDQSGRGPSGPSAPDRKGWRWPFSRKRKPEGGGSPDKRQPNSGGKPSGTPSAPGPGGGGRWPWRRNRDSEATKPKPRAPGNGGGGRKTGGDSKSGQQPKPKQSGVLKDFADGVRSGAKAAAGHDRWRWDARRQQQQQAEERQRANDARREALLTELAEASQAEEKKYRSPPRPCCRVENPCQRHRPKGESSPKGEAMHISDDSSLQKWGRTLKKIGPAIEENLIPSANKYAELVDGLASGVAKLATQGESDLPADRQVLAETQAVSAELRAIKEEQDALNMRLRAAAGRAASLGPLYDRQHETDEARLAGERGSRHREKRADVTAAEQDT